MNSSSEADVNSDGLMTTVQPAASAGASFHATSISGEFHGVMKRAHADRLLEDVGEVVGPVGRHHRALDLVGQPAVVIEPLRHVLGLRAPSPRSACRCRAPRSGPGARRASRSAGDAAHASCRARSGVIVGHGPVSKARAGRLHRPGPRRPCRTRGSAPTARPCRGRRSGTSCRRRHRHHLPSM